MWLVDVGKFEMELVMDCSSYLVGLGDSQILSLSR